MAENVVLFTSGVDSVLTYWNLKSQNVINVDLAYLPITHSGYVEVLGEMATLRLYTHYEKDIITYPIYVFNRKRELWAESLIPVSEGVPYLIPHLLLSVVTRYHDVKNIYLGFMKEDVDEQFLETIEKLSSVLSYFAGREIRIKSAFDWEKFKSEAMSEVYNSLSDGTVNKLKFLKSLLYAYSSDGHLNFSNRGGIHTWFSNTLPWMKIKTPEAKSVISVILNSRREVPSFDRRNMSTRKDFMYNANVYEFTGVVFPFVNVRLLEEIKREALDFTGPMPVHLRRVILGYITELDRINYALEKTQYRFTLPT